MKAVRFFVIALVACAVIVLFVSARKTDRLPPRWKSNVWTPYEVHRLVRETLTGQRDLASR